MYVHRNECKKLPQRQSFNDEDPKSRILIQWLPLMEKPYAKAIPPKLHFYNSSWLLSASFHQFVFTIICIYVETNLK